MAQRFIKRLLALVCVFALLLPVPSLGTSPYPFVGYIIESTALRSNASNKAGIVVQLPAGSAVQVTGEKDGFYIAAYDGKIGYVSQQSVTDNFDPGATQFGAPAADYKTAASYPLLGQGDSGDAVEDLQNALKELGFLTGKVDGKYGSQTKDAVAAFQKSNKLTETGVADPNTQQTLFEKSVVNSRGRNMYVKTIGAVAQVNVRQNDRGTQVKAIQNRLKELGYYKGTADGVYGLATANAVKELQRAHRIKADGVVGAKTREALALGNVLPTDAPKQQAAVTVTLSPQQIAQYEQSQKQEATYPYVTTASDPVNLRTRASTRSTRLVTVPRGASINVLSVANDDWLKVEYGTRTGYVMAQYVNIPEIYLPGKSFDVDSSARIRYETLGQGASGTKVSTLQEALNELNFYSDKIDGLYGSGTARAVQNFQNANGYKATGIALPEMQQLLYEGKPKNSQGRKVSLAILPPVDNPDMTIGDKGRQVESLQTTLAALGFYQGAIDGIYGRKTANAVKAYQKAHSLRQTGKMNSFTWLSLNAVLSTPAPGSNDYYVDLNENNVIVMTKGTRGTAVTRLETRLVALGYTQAVVDGVYDNKDIEAVRAFQRNNGLTSSGTADLNTQRALFSDSAIGASGGAPEGWQSLNSPAPPVTVTVAPEVNETLRIGSTGEAVEALQSRLISLQYLSGKADGIYGTQTARAVTAFQKASKLQADGIAGQQTLTALYGADAPSNLPAAQPGLSQSGALKRTMRIGDRGDDVKQLQQILYRLGYLSGGIDGIFGPSTGTAVSAFQKKNSLTADRIVGSLTWAKLNASNAVGASSSLINQGSGTGSSSSPAQSQGFTAPKASEVRFAMWYSEVKARAKSMPKATIYDFMTGKHYNVNIFSNGAHADAEPITAKDTATMEAALGKDSWTPRPVWVIFSDGRVYMASTHSRGHEVDHNPNNNLQGHICIHFPREMSEAEKTGPYAVSHQNAILAGWDVTQSMIK